MSNQLHEQNNMTIGYRQLLDQILLVLKAQNGLAPLYIADLLTPYVPSRNLRPADQLLLKVPPRQGLITEGDSFYIL